MGNIFPLLTKVTCKCCKNTFSVNIKTKQKPSVCPKCIVIAMLDKDVEVNGCFVQFTVQDSFYVVQYKDGQWKALSQKMYLRYYKRYRKRYFYSGPLDDCLSYISRRT